MHEPEVKIVPGRSVVIARTARARFPVGWRRLIVASVVALVVMFAAVAQARADTDPSAAPQSGAPPSSTTGTDPTASTSDAPAQAADSKAAGSQAADSKAKPAGDTPAPTSGKASSTDAKANAQAGQDSPSNTNVSARVDQPGANGAV